MDFFFFYYDVTSMVLKESGLLNKIRKKKRNYFTYTLGEIWSPDAQFKKSR